MRQHVWALAAAALLAHCDPSLAQVKTGASPLLPGGDAHAPVNVNADKLEYFSKEQKAIYTGHVVARQGEGTLRAAALSIFFIGSNSQPGGPAMAAGSQVSRMEAKGPVTIVQRDQVGVGDSALYDRARDEVVLTGNVSLTQGPDVVKGDRLVYNLATGQAEVIGRVTSLFVPGSGGSGFASSVAEHKKIRSGPKGRRP